MHMTRLIIVGGFLGAGKTTLLWETAKHFINKGMKVGLITNDQAPELVDSAILKLSGLSVAEVSGSCFCCNFNGFTEAIKKLQNGAPDVIIAEPVGSCADLSATILQPLKKFHGAELELAPFTVLADPNRLPSILEGGNGGLHPDAAYIFGKQLEESDILLLTKTDALEPAKKEELMKKLAEKYPTSTVMAVSALTGDGMDAWIEQVTTRNDVGKKLLRIDYDRYAHGEAVLGWLNGTVKLLATEETDWNQLAETFIQDLAKAFEKEGLPVGHVKAIVENGSQFAVSNLTQDSRTVTLRGDAGKGTEATLVINARVETTPEHLDELVRAELKQLLADKYEQTELAWKFLQPGRPNPTHRFVEIV
ncbi:MAG: cobalamin synthesis protein P47K [Bacteroidaceae bacterium]|nr:cobalamin synthesis protein P47K [Bacteroidaceae bacterium]